jgi:hypothetical protein
VDGDYIFVDEKNKIYSASEVFSSLFVRFVVNFFSKSNIAAEKQEVLDKPPKLGINYRSRSISNFG